MSSGGRLLHLHSMAWGTKIVGGVTPGREGFHLGLPVLPIVRQAMEQLKPDATAIEGEVPLIVAVAEHIPLRDALRSLAVLEQDDDTDAIALVGEISGTGEIDAASWIREHISRTRSQKPIIALVAGLTEASNQVMGHAGAFTVLGEPDARTKIVALEDTGATIVSHPEKFGEAFNARLDALATRGQVRHRKGSTGAVTKGEHRRQFHLDSRIGGNGATSTSPRVCMDLLRASGETSCGAGGYSGHGERRLLAIGINRSARSPCVIAAPTTEQECLVQTVKRYPFDFGCGRGPSELDIQRIAEHLQLRDTGMAADSLGHTVDSLTAIFYEKEAFLLTTHIVEQHGPDPEVQRSGSVYIRLVGDGAVGTAVNGAGLAMNTVDALQGNAANFLDTGDKATSDTVKASFELVLRDPRALFWLSLKVPVVVRIRGTKEEEGQQLIAESGLPLYAFNDFDEAAAKAVELSMRKPGSQGTAPYTKALGCTYAEGPPSTYNIPSMPSASS
ncbi:succinyl-CoA synthetase-like protein [Lasiosphaeria ovina]|uniref:Succinyl-CoA synthetase-like protein n=1 Tax=Lasiosphaeria ovina TaxID=92902 RepID=A0AAE0MZH5_9PEZI|nr:succinyl-CoA synthetase-like protein [Lasiosphaeria ovina]